MYETNTHDQSSMPSHENSSNTSSETLAPAGKHSLLLESFVPPKAFAPTRSNPLPSSNEISPNYPQPLNAPSPIIFARAGMKIVSSIVPLKL